MMFGIRNGRNIHGIMKWQNQRESPLTTQLLDPGPPEIELSDYGRLPIPDIESPTGLLNGEGLRAEPIADLDIFFEQIYSYYCEKGLYCIIIKWIVEILSVIFVEWFIWFFLLVVDWRALRNVKCGIDAIESGNWPCDLPKEAMNKHPLVPFTFTKGIIVGSLIILAIYGLFNFLKFIVQFKSIQKVRDFYYNSLNITDRELQITSWPAILEKIIQLQQSQQLCVVKDLSAHDIVMRIMRKENYLIGMINKGVLALPVSWWVPGAGPAVNVQKDGRKYHLILPKTLEWTMNWCIFQSMFDSNFCIRREFVTNPSLLKKRLKIVGILKLLISPCLIIFMVVYLFLKHAEPFYRHPSIAISRRWSNLAKWIFREFNEVEHLFRYRISNSTEHATNYLKQFPSPLVTPVAKFISFVSGGLGAVLIIMAIIDESLLEGHIFGRNLLWYAAIFGSVAAISRAAIADELQVLDHEGAMSLVVQHTHYMPKRWRGKENSNLVRSEFETLFQYTLKMLVEEIISIFLTPFLLIFVVPKRVDDILRFISDNTVYVEGVGHVCSFSVFDFESHGNRRYGSPYDATREKSSQGKMEKSFLSFQSTYPFWEPSGHGKQFLSTLCDFKEKQVQQIPPLQDHSATPSWLRTADLRDQSDAIISSHNGLYHNGGISRNVQRLINPEPRKHHYILDWYYISKPHGQTEDLEVCPSVDERAFQLNHDFPFTQNKMQTEIENGDESWHALSDRFHSHLEASTSRPLLKNSAMQIRDLDNHTMNRWWTRAGTNPTSVQASFLEPPTFAGQNYSNHSDNVADTSSEVQLVIDGGKGKGSRHNLSKTTYLDESDEDELPFVDGYDEPYKNLTVRIIPRSNDPIQ